MLKRLYINNFRCLVNFEITFDSIHLLLGSNGVGKSTIFEVLRKIQSFISGDQKVNKIFQDSDYTRWQNAATQSFELEVSGNAGIYKYELGVSHHQGKSRVEYERLWFDQKPLLKFELGEVQLYRDNHSEGPAYSFDWSQSMISLLTPRNDNTKLTWFKERIERLIIVQIIPCLMGDESQQESVRLSPHMENYVSWYRYLSEDQGKVTELNSILKGVLEGFSHFKFNRVSEQILVLKLHFNSDTNYSNSVEYRFKELSDGQKVLIALYTLLHSVKSEDYTILIDEPENFLALPEIQPWLVELYDLCSRQQLQALLISHHPELINYLLASPIGYWFERQSNAPVRVKRISNEEAKDSGLPMSELIARGWLSGPE